jgi:hypothetical protein
VRFIAQVESIRAVATQVRERIGSDRDGKGLERSRAAVGQCLGRQDASDVCLEWNGHDSVGCVSLCGTDPKLDQRGVVGPNRRRRSNEEQTNRGQLSQCG